MTAGLSALSLFVAAAGDAAGGPRFLGPPGGNFKSIAYLEPATLLAGTSSGRIFLSTDAGEHWFDVSPPGLKSGDIVEEIVAHPASSSFFAAVRNLEGGRVLRAGVGRLRHRAQAGPAADECWQVLFAGEPILSLAVSPADPPDLYAGTLDRLYRSAGGSHWDYVGFKAADPQIESIVIDPADPRTIYAGTWQRAYRSRDGGLTWQPVHAGMQADRDVFSMVFDREGALYAGTCGHIYRLAPGAAAWVPFRSGLTGKRVHCLALAPGGQVVAGTEDGLFELAGDRKTWRQLLPGVVVQAVAIDPAGRIVCATEGDGVLRLAPDTGALRFMNAGISASCPKRLIEASDGRLTVGLLHQNSHGGLWSFDGRAWSRRPIPIEGCDVTDFVELAPDWVIGTTAGLMIWREGESAARPVHLLAGRSITRLFAIPGRRLVVVGTLAGLYALDLESGKLRRQPGMESCKVNAIWAPAAAPDRLMVGCENGLFVYSHSENGWQPADFRLPDVKIYDILGDETGATVLAATDHGLLVTHDGGRYFARQTRGLPELPCIGLAERAGEVLALFSNGGLYFQTFDGFGWYRLAELDLPVWSLCIPRRGQRVFLGSYGFGVLELDLPDAPGEPAPTAP